MGRTVNGWPHQFPVKAMPTLTVVMSKSLRNTCRIVYTSNTLYSAIHLMNGEQGILFAIHYTKMTWSYEASNIPELTEVEYSWNGVSVTVMYKAICANKGAE